MKAVMSKKLRAGVPAAELQQTTLDFFGGDILRTKIFLDKYALRNDSNEVVEFLPSEMWTRVARAISSVESPDRRPQTFETFKWLLEDFKFIPGGRILFGAGANRNVTLLNCYVIPIRNDSIEGIFDWMKEAAKTYSYGGGVGVDIALLRPKGAKVNNAALSSTGSVSFMDLFSLTTGTIGQHGRRGALMITTRDSHPDILDFLRVKRDLKTVRFANISVRVSDELMRAVEADGDFALHFENDKVSVKKTVKARELWNELIKGAHSWAEPGILFWDAIKRESTSEYNGMEVISVNPCGEISLNGYGDCCLGNLNLSKFVLKEFSDEAAIDWENLERAARAGVRFLDNVLDYNMDRHALKEQSEASRVSRRIGLGFTGLGDMLCQMRLKYDSAEAVTFVGNLFERIKNIAYLESTKLAQEKGTFPNYDKSRHFANPFISRLDPSVRREIDKHGLRNVALLTVPPVGSGAALAGTTSGVEPIFALSYTRRSESLSQEFFKVYHPLVARFMTKNKITDEKDVPEFFATAHTISPISRVKMQATIQAHIDHAISSTVNLPREASEADVSEVYMQAWKLGCKGITVYREGSREGILITNDETKRSGNSVDSEIKAPPATASGPIQQEAGSHKYLLPRPRPKTTDGHTERIETPRGPLYVTINEDSNGLCEIFVKSLDVEAEAIGRTVSMLLRSNVDPREVIEQLWSVQSREMAIDRSEGVSVTVTTVAQGIALAMGRYLYGNTFDPRATYPKADNLPEPTRTGAQLRLRFSPPVPASMNGHSNGNGNGSITIQQIQEVRPQHKAFSGLCPDCGNSLVNENGCSKCVNCGYSKCG